MAVYLDHAATTPVHPKAIDAYTRAMSHIGNPSSIHSIGQEAKQLLEEAREGVAATLGCDPIEIIFTSGGTESINLAIKGLFWARNSPINGDNSRAVVRPRPRILAPGGEHHATVDTLEWLEEHEGALVEWIPLDADGSIDLAALETALRTDTERVSLLTMVWANNEVGSIQPVVAVAALAAECGIPLHLDAVSAYGHLDIDFDGLRQVSNSRESGLVALSVSAHKIGGPVGIGALALSRQAVVIPLIHGGGQQRQVRSGTQDVAASVAFAVAADEAAWVRESETQRLSALRDRLIRGVTERVPCAVLNGPDPVIDSDVRLSMNAHFTFPGCEGDSLLFLLDAAGFAVSTGSACQAGVAEPSHVLRAMGRDVVSSRGALRVTLGRTTTGDDIEAFLQALPAAYDQALRAGMADRATTIGGSK